MKYIFIPVIFLFLNIFSYTSEAQNYFRIRADFSTKEKYPDGKMRLTMGTAFYDKVVNKLIYKVKFPQKEIWVFKDTTTYLFKNDTLIRRLPNPYFQNTSIFSFALSGYLSDFGLNRTFFHVTEVKKEDEFVIITWTPEKKFQKTFGNIITSKKNNKLYGIAIFDPMGALINKQIFDKYVIVDNVAFPTEVIQIQYTKKGENYRITNYKNIVINEKTKHYYYNYIVP